VKAFVVWNGLNEYREELRQLPEACTGEAAHIVEAGANGAYQTISSFYGAHHFTGTLQKRLTLTPLKEAAFATGLKLTSGSPLAWLFDNGSQARHYVTEHGVTHVTGRMPPTHIFSSTVGKTKRAIVQHLKEMVLRRGATAVTGE
jgi:hypothetical protein